MHADIPSHRLNRSWHSCPRPVNAGNNNALSMHHPWRRNVTSCMVGLKKKENVPQAKIPPKMMNPRETTGNTEEKPSTQTQAAVNIQADIMETCIHTCMNQVMLTHMNQKWDYSEWVCFQIVFTSFVFRTFESVYASDQSWNTKINLLIAYLCVCVCVCVCVWFVCVCVCVCVYVFSCVWSQTDKCQGIRSGYIWSCVRKL